MTARSFVGYYITYIRFNVPQFAAMATRNCIMAVVNRIPAKGLMLNYKFGWGKASFNYCRDLGNLGVCSENHW
jgi:hypothetical protein